MHSFGTWLSYISLSAAILVMVAHEQEPMTNKQI
jgi:hypothetical protein